MSAAVKFITLGCPKNEVDSDRMRLHVGASGYGVVEDIAQADIVVLNTCGFIVDAVEESVDIALDLAVWRDQRPGRKLVLVGCMVSRYGDNLREAMPEVDGFVSLANPEVLPALIGDLMGTPLVGSVEVPVRCSRAPFAYVQIADGCSRKCAYCTIPSIRGAYRSRSLSDVRTEAESLVATGARELVLIGQDISGWGKDFSHGETLADLVRTLVRIRDLEWLRLMYVQPDGVTDELVELMATEEVVCRYLDIPLQHVSQGVLESMNRRGSYQNHLDLIGKIRHNIPDIVLRSSFILGSPGETDDDVDELLGFVEEARLDYVGVFPFSPEEGTAAYDLPHQVPRAERLERAQRVRDAVDLIGFDKAATFIGRTVPVLIEGVDEDGATVGRTRSQAPDVDGCVMVETSCQPGSIVQCVITDSVGYDLFGEVADGR